MIEYEKFDGIDMYKSIRISLMFIFSNNFKNYIDIFNCYKKYNPLYNLHEGKDGKSCPIYGRLHKRACKIGENFKDSEYICKMCEYEIYPANIYCKANGHYVHNGVDIRNCNLDSISTQSIYKLETYFKNNFQKICTLIQNSMLKDFLMRKDTNIEIIYKLFQDDFGKMNFVEFVILVFFLASDGKTNQMFQ